MEDNKLILNSLILIAIDLVGIVKGEGGANYYSKSLKAVIDISEVENIIKEAELLNK